MQFQRQRHFRRKQKHRKTKRKTSSRHSKINRRFAAARHTIQQAAGGMRLCQSLCGIINSRLLRPAERKSLLWGRQQSAVRLGIRLLAMLYAHLPSLDQRCQRRGSPLHRLAQSTAANGTLFV